MSRVLLVAGARPNFMKISPIIDALHAAGEDHVLVHTGQHYDEQMSAAFFGDLDIPPPDYNLNVGSASHAAQTARIMQAFEPVLTEVRPEWVVVVGDVNSTLACALVAVKLKGEVGCRIAHVEAGLRSGDWRMPEEVNRVLTDQISDVLFLPSRDAHANLVAEGIPEHRQIFVGNVMVDTLFRSLPKAVALDIPGKLGLESGRYVVATLHRPSNVDSADSLSAILEGFQRIARRMPIVLPIHPRTRRAAETMGLTDLLRGIRVTEPLGYLEMLSLTNSAAVALTDSGGLQEETTALGVPCVTLRESTERPITIREGTNRLAPWPLSVEGLIGSFESAVARGRRSPGEHAPEGWDGQAAIRIVEHFKIPAAVT
ncbi:MAG TPA: UDP-N-acetylglucosamine 2-epimerase (non-hydrolyzing) [Gemmatimonadaceae bacterium]|nr:UDP-N-acetylglucosamine 2-epimerase (non-hydrolyzing) [Gemmatimonadaceae bacterium]